MTNKHRFLNLPIKPLLVGAVIFTCNVISAQNVDLIYTTASERWVEAKRFLKKTPASTADITVYTDQKLQVIDGIGGSFNEMGWEALQSLDEQQQDAVINAIFSKEGCNFSMCRMPIGASDYALSYYSHNDVAEDFEMRDFNIDRDRYILMPYIKAALAVRPDLQVWASPWSPPAWMKVNEHYAMREGDFENAKKGNKLVEGGEILNNATGFKMQERYLKAYALYFSKFVQAYKKEGIALAAIQPQNEIAYQPNWPSCTWRPEDMAYFINDFLGPQFQADNLNTKIWLGTVNSGDPNYVKTVLNYKDTAKFIDGVGFQWGGAKSIPTIHKEFPELKLMQTENKCGEHENDWTSVARSWSDLVHYTNNGAGSYMYWNMILDETGASAWGWPQNSMVVIDKNTKAVTYTDEFYLFKHVSHFVQPGDHLLKSSEGKNHLAYQLKDGRIMVLINNPEATKKTITIAIGNQKIGVEVQPTSINSVLVKS
ncbi:glycoside hydrolase family 30 protein [Formosa haliotis]|uniref:glycoside hydrolase family 30 protein n=1 Tax=Formosa haliotis TaxID=1555194 RepID=UPI000825BFA2|nr:glycosyl hydrolase family 30 [Formosa haliotis]